jgi:hypothetical protein
METEMEWKLDVEEFTFAGCMTNCSGNGPGMSE